MSTCTVFYAASDRWGLFRVPSTSILLLHALQLYCVLCFMEHLAVTGYNFSSCSCTCRRSQHRKKVMIALLPRSTLWYTFLLSATTEHLLLLLAWKSQLPISLYIRKVSDAEEILLLNRESVEVYLLFLMHDNCCLIWAFYLLLTDLLTALVYFVSYCYYCHSVIAITISSCTA